MMKSNSIIKPTIMRHNFGKVDYSFATVTYPDGSKIEVGDCGIGCNGWAVASVPTCGSPESVKEQSRANARRIAACINYCESMTTEELEKNHDGNKTTEAK